MFNNMSAFSNKFAFSNAFVFSNMFAVVRSRAGGATTLQTMRGAAFEWFDSMASIGFH